MTLTYNITGMTCGGCVSKVQHLLAKVPGVNKVTINLAKAEAEIDMNQPVATENLRAALNEFPQYQLSALHHQHHIPAYTINTAKKTTWPQTYKPILLIFGYIIVITVSVEYILGDFLWMRWMNHFMAGFFVVFSFFKFLNLKGFAESYSRYDIVAKQWNGWGYVYAFTELVLGIAFLTGFNPLFTNAVTLIVMGVSIIGVWQSVLNKRTIQCACLGDVFNLPMSTVTIIEDALMITMSGIMLFKLLQ